MAQTSSMLEFDIFIPLIKPDGKRISAGKLQGLKKRLLQQFGGVTYFPQRNEGLWKVGNYVFRDKIVIYRVIGDGGRPTQKFLRDLKLKIKKEWQQQDVLIVKRAIEIV
jgi:hypothetical protein